MRICFFGDSFTAGVGDETGLGWVGRVLIAASRRGMDVTGYNLGVRRDTSLDIAARWRAEAGARLPDDQDGRLVFCFGANDCATENKTSRVPPNRAVAVVRTILAEAAGWKPTLMIGPLPIADDETANARL